MCLKKLIVLLFISYTTNLFGQDYFICSKIKSKNKKPKIPEELKITVEEISGDISPCFLTKPKN